MSKTNKIKGMQILNEKLENYKYFTASLVFLVLSKVISLLFRMGSRIIIARYSSVDIYGLFSVIWNEMTFISTVALLGLGQSLTINLPRENREEKINSVLSALMFSLIVGVISLVISLIFYIINLDNTYKYSALISTFFIIFLFVQFVFIGLKDFLGYFIQILTQSLTMFILIIILRNILTIDLMVYLTFGSIAFSLIISFIYLLLRTKISLKSISLSDLKIFNFSKKRLSLFLVDIVNSIILYLLLKIPQVMVNNSLAGYINVAFSLVTFLLIPPQMISIVLGPIISKDFHESRISELNNSFRLSLGLLYIIQGIAIIVFSYFGNFFIKLLYGNEYITGSFLIFYGFLLAIIIDSFNYPFAFYIRNTNHERLFALGKIISLVCFIVPAPLMLYFFDDFVNLAIPVAYLISITSLLSFYFFYTIKLNERFELKDVKNITVWLAFVFISLISAMLTVNFIANQYYVLLILFGNLIAFGGFIVITKIINIKSIFIDLKEIIINLKNKNQKETIEP